MDAQVIMQGPAGTATVKPIHLVDDPADLDALSSDLAWNILKALKTRPDFPGSIAKKLGVHEQKIYYHIRRLAAAGILKVVKQEQRRGGLSSYYAPVADAFGIQLHGKGTSVTTGPGAAPAKLREFLGEFSRDGILDGYVVVGSPHPHGPFLTVARDSPYAVQLGLRLGQLFAPPKGLTVRLDTEVKAEGLERSNMMLVGGPVANIISMEANEHLKVRFEWKDAWKIQSSITGRTYSEEYSGLIAKVPNPWRTEKRMLLLWGLHYTGTLATILGVTQFSEKVLGDYDGEPEFYKVVLGQDRDGDGKLDEVSILE
jgi:hypothetical protein